MLDLIAKLEAAVTLGAGLVATFYLDFGNGTSYGTGRVELRRHEMLEIIAALKARSEGDTGRDGGK